MIDETERNQWHQAAHRQTELFKKRLWDALGLDSDTANPDERAAITRAARELGSDDIDNLATLISRARHNGPQADDAHQH